MKTKKRESSEKKDSPGKWDIFDYFPDATYVTTYDGVFLYANQEACKLWGKKREDIVGHPIYIVFPQAKGSVLEEKRNECLASGKPLIAEFYFPSPPYEGWYEIMHSPCPDGIVTRFKIIAEKKKASQSIDFLYELLSMFLNQLEQPILITDLRYRIKEGNRAIVKFAKVSSKSSLIGKDFFKQFCPEKETDLKPVFQEVFQWRKSKTILLDDLYLTISTIFDYFDLPLYYIIFFRKVENQKSLDPNLPIISDNRSEKTLPTNRLIDSKQDTKFFETLWDQSGIPTAVFDPKGALLCVNEAMNTLFSGQIKLDYNLLNDLSISKETRKKIRDNKTIHIEKYFGPEETKIFFLNKTTAIRDEYYFDIFIKPFFDKNKHTLLGYLLKIVDRLEAKKKEDLRDQLFDRVLSSFKESTDQLKESINTLLLFAKNADEKKFLTKNIKLQKQILSSLVDEISDFQQMEIKKRKLSNHKPPPEESC